MQNKTIRILTYVLIGLLVVGVIGFVAYFTNGFKSDFKTFYISVDGKDIMKSDGGYKVSKGKPLEIKVKYVFSGRLIRKRNTPLKSYRIQSTGEISRFRTEKKKSLFKALRILPRVSI